MLNADLTAAGSLVSNFATQQAALSGLTGSALATQQAVVLAAGRAAQVECLKLAQLLGVQRQINARSAIAAILDLASIPPMFQPIEQFAFTVEAMTEQCAVFADYSGQADGGLASYGLLATRWTALSALLTAEPNLISG